MDYDFNKLSNLDRTVEETIMEHLTNDLGDSVLPHVAHIIISEFRKFMFLVGEHIRETERRKQGKYTQFFHVVITPA